MRLKKMKLFKCGFEIRIKEGVYMTEKWILCPVCGNKTRDRIRGDTVLKNYPLYCPKCKHETLIEVTNLEVTAIAEPDAQPQSR